MPKYINADETYDDMLTAMAMTGYQSRALSVIDRQPTADVAPVVHAHWVYLGLGVYKCSDCLGDYNDNTAFCPNCGAKMDEEAPER